MKRLLRKQLPAFLLVLALLTGTIPTVAAAGADFSYKVKAGKEVVLDRDDFKDYFEDECEYDDFTCMVVDDAGKLDSYGEFVAENMDGDEVALDADDLEDAYFYYKASEMEDEDYDYDLDTLKFVANDNIKKDVTLSLDITLYDDTWTTDEACTLEIKITGTSGSSSSSASGDIEYEVDPGKEITIDRKDFKELFEEEYSNFTYLYFTDISNLSGNGIFYAYDYDEEETKLSESILEEACFYYSSASMYEEDYELGGMSFVASKNADGEVVSLDFTMYGKSSKDKMTGTLTIAIGDVDEDADDDDEDVDADIIYKLNEDDDVSFDRKDFLELFEKEYDDEELMYVVFSDIENLADTGSLYATDYDNEDVYLTESEIEDARFYYSGVDMEEDEDHYELNSIVFESDDGTDGEVVTMDFTAYGDVKSRKVSGSVAILIGKTAASSKDDDDDDDKDADITYSVDPDDEVTFDRKDFKELFEKDYKDLSYVVFTDADNLDDTGKLYALNYDEEETRIKESALDDAYFYYASSDVEDEDYDYELDSITFKANDDTDGEVVTLEFTMYGKTSKNKVSGVLTIEIGEVGSTSISGSGSADIRYTTTYNSSVQLNANHFASFLKASYPNSSLQYVKITGVPSAGSVYYDYYNTSDYGEKVRLTSTNCDDYKFYFSPDDEDEYALTELSFIPNGFNYCPAISFTAYGSGSKSVSGEILISVTLNKIPDVYGVTPKGTTVTFPASSINSAISTGTGAGVGSIRLLKLPTSSQGSVRLSNGLKADTKTLYTYSTSGNYAISSLQFVPATGFTGNVEIPYVAYNASGNAVGSGIFSLGVVNSVPKFKDVTSATWCYKYVAEMCDAGVINGYGDNTYRPNSALTYGAALKLIMLAAGYEKQAEPANNRFVNYLTLAKKEGIVSGNPNLGGSITRLQVAQIAAKAMDLDTSELSSVKPFTDTSDKYVQALNAAGIVEGYFSNGTSTFKGGNTLTRGHISAIVWRMENYEG